MADFDADMRALALEDGGRQRLLREEDDGEGEEDDARPLRARGSSRYSDEEPETCREGWRRSRWCWCWPKRGTCDNDDGDDGDDGDKLGYRILQNGTGREPGSFSAAFTIKEELGKGSTAKCFACVEKTSGKPFAVKVINKRKVSVLYSDLLPQFRREVDILRRFEHPNIIRLHTVFESPSHLHVVTELARGGELFDYLVSRPNSTLTEAKVSFLMRQCISAVAYMHAHNVIHRDLKLENILLHAKVEHYRNIQLKIIDFGLSKILPGAVGDAVSGVQVNGAGSPHSMASPLSTRTFFGTMGYIAPEMMHRRAYTRAIDAWALGVVAFVLLCGVFPFDEKRQQRRTDYRLRYPSWVKDLSASAQDLLGSLLHTNPAKRCTAAQALKHPWVAGATASPAAVIHSPRHLRGLKPPPDLSAALEGASTLSGSHSPPASHDLPPNQNINTQSRSQAVTPKMSRTLDNNDDDDDDDDDNDDNDDEDEENDGHSSSSSSLGSPSLR